MDIRTYVCASCKTPLFSLRDKIAPLDGWPTFRKPIDENDIEFKSGPSSDGSVDIRCKKCRSHLGTVVGQNQYRIYSVALDLEKAPSIEIELPDGENDENAKEKNGETDIVTKLKSAAGFIGGAILGGIVGASVAYLICQNFCAPTTGTLATTTPAIATSTPATSTPNTTPRATSSLEATSASTQSPDISTSTPDTLDSGSSSLQ